MSSQIEMATTTETFLRFTGSILNKSFQQGVIHFLNVFRSREIAFQSMHKVLKKMHKNADVGKNLLKHGCGWVVNFQPLKFGIARY